MEAEWRQAMAINSKEFKSIGLANIKQHKKDKLKFLFDFRVNGKRYRKVVTLQERPNWSLREYKKELVSMLNQYREDILSGYKLNETLSVDDVFELYVKNNPVSENWDNKRRRIYNLYLKNEIGRKKIGKVKEIDLLQILTALKDKGLKSTTRKRVLDVIKPVFKFAHRNKIIKENPAENINVKVKDTKKMVTNAGEKLKKVYTGIMEVFADDPFYRALFLFALTGRRKSEILNLKWEHIDFENNYYWIADTKPNENQRYDLPPIIKLALLELGPKASGYVFESPVKKGKPINKIDRQVDKLKEHIKMPEFHMHYCRNILTSALLEKGVSTSILSGVLGHKNATTINKYVSINYHASTQKANQEMLEIIEPK